MYEKPQQEGKYNVKKRLIFKYLNTKVFKVLIEIQLLGFLFPSKTSDSDCKQGLTCNEGVCEEMLNLRQIVKSKNGQPLLPNNGQSKNKVTIHFQAPDLISGQVGESRGKITQENILNGWYNKEAISYDHILCKMINHLVLNLKLPSKQCRNCFQTVRSACTGPTALAHYAHTVWDNYPA